MRTRKSHKLWLVAGGIVAAVAASGGAFTAGLQLDDATEVVSAGNVTALGGTVLAVEYTHAYDATDNNSYVSDVIVTFDDVYPQDTTVDLDLFIDDVEFTDCNEATSVPFDYDADGTTHDSTVFTCDTPSAPFDVDGNPANDNDTHIVINAEAPPVASVAY